MTLVLLRFPALLAPRFPRIVASAAALLLIAACSIGPDYVKPETAAPTFWKTPLADAEPAVWPEEDWWRGFESPVLDGFIQRARRNNNDIAAAAARVVQAEAQIRVAGAGLFPFISGGADVARSHSRGLGSSSIPARTTNSFGGLLLASYELDVWGRNRAARDAAEAIAYASHYDLETIAISIVADVAATHFQILELRDRMTIAVENLENAERVLDVVEARFKAGAASPLEVAQQRTVVANQRASIPALESQLRQAENALAVLLGEIPEAVTVAAGSLDDLAVPLVVTGLPSELLARRPDIRSAEAQLMAANANITIARAALFPSIQLTGRYGFESDALVSLFTGPGMFYTLAAGLTQPIFQGGRLRGQVDVSEARHEELVQLYRGTVISAFRDVENALAVIRQAVAREVLQLDAVEQSRIAFAIAEAQYRAGAVDLLTVLDAQRSLFQATDQLVQTKSVRLQGIVFLYRALGGGWPG